MAEPKKKKASALPKSLPLDLDGAFALQQDFPADAPKRMGGPASKSKLDAAAQKLKLPAEIVAFYERCDGIGDVRPLKELAPLQRRFAQEVKRALDEGDDEPEGDDLGIGDFGPTSALIAIGFDGGGDTLFVDPRRRTKEGTLPVLRFVHDESCVVRVEAPSIGAYVAWQFLLAWENSSVSSNALGKLMKAERKRGLPRK